MSRPLRTIAASAAALAVVGIAGPSAVSAAPALTPSEVGEAANGPGVFRFPQAVAVDPTTGTIFVGDQYSGRIQAFAPNGRFRFAFSGRASRDEPGRIGVVGGLATDRSGHVYVADSENQRIQVFSSTTGQYLTQFGQDDDLRLLAGGRSDRGIVSGGIAAYQSSPQNSVVVYVADSGGNRILRYHVNAATGRPYSSPRASSSSLGLKRPQGVGIDPNGRTLFVPDNQNHRVQVLDPTTLERRAVFGRRGSGPGQFESPYDVAVDARTPRQVYVADNLNGRVNVFDARTFDYVGTFGGNGHAVGLFSIVRAVAASASDRAGGVAVADTANNRIQLLRPDGDVYGAWGIAGRGPGYVTRPRGVAIGPDGTIAAADTFDNRISLTAPDGTWAGQRGQVSRSTGFVASGNGPGRFLLPEGVAVDAQNRTWVADTGNHRVVGLDGNGTQFFSTPTGALTRPGAVAVAPDGTVYVTDRTRGQLLSIPPGGGGLRVVRSGLDAPNAVAVSPATGQVLVGGRRTLRDAATNVRIPPSPGATSWDHVSGLAVGPDGTIYVSELATARPGGARVVRGTPQTGGGYAWDTIAAEGTGAATVIEPQAIAVSPDGGTVLVADAGNDRILRLDAPGSAPPPTNALTITNAGVTRGTVTSDPAGIDCATDCVQSFGPTRTVTLTARPTEGSIFAGWSGDCAGAGTNPTCAVGMERAKNVGAAFTAPPPPPVKLSTLSLTPRTWHLTRPKAKRLAQRRATRATLAFSVTQKSAGTLQVQEARTGRRRGGTCRPLAAGSRTTGNCTRWATLPGTRKLRLIPGATKIELVPRVVRRTLSPGRYRLVVTATDAQRRTVARHSGTFRVTR